MSDQATMTDNLQGMPMEDLSVKESEPTVSFMVQDREFKINKSLLLRKVRLFQEKDFPFPLRADIETFEIFVSWLHEDKLPVLHGTYHEQGGGITYAGYDPEVLYNMAVFMDLEALADNIMDCVRKIHNSVGVGFTKDAIERIYNEQYPHVGLALFASLWIYLEETRPNNYLKLISEAERAELLENDDIAMDMAMHRGPWFTGTRSRCRFHYHVPTIAPRCVRTHRIEVCVWVINKHDELETLEDWRNKNLLTPPAQEQGGSALRLSKV
ncbi:hypothetical protein EAE96_005104 [Botrytis aclada]|nr:hypothetical protein EAE96_005104 [Botrytis aclada]